jgi:hypothetical protein
MITWLKKIFGFEELAIQNSLLKELLANKDQELKNYRNFHHYVSLPVPSGEAVTRYLSDLGKQQMFAFYLMTLENSMMILFRTGKNAEQVKGAMEIIDHIREDMRTAWFAEGKKNAKV